MKYPHAISLEALIAELKTNLTTGLQPQEVRHRMKHYGPNQIAKNDTMPVWKILLAQVKSPIAYLLFFASAASFYFNEWLDGFAILIVLLINTLIGFYMEFQADRSMQALQKLASVPAKVVRDKKLQEINSEQIVPGDILFLEAGDMITADARISRLSQLQINESALTGESVPVEKSMGVLSENSALAEQTNMLFKGTFVSKGNTWAVVTSTGMQTELGKIANLVQSAEQSITPLEKKLEEFSKKLIKLTVVLVFIIFLSGWLMGHELFEMIYTSIALAVAAIPEGLPIVATLGLARGMLKMAKQHVIVKKLSAIETLGSTTVICTDKTGTLTENKMSVKSVIPAIPDSTVIDELIIRGIILCNTADLNDQGIEVGDPLETALLKYSEQYESVPVVRAKYSKVNEEPFSSETKRMITVHKSEDRFIAFAKGATEEILRICSGNMDTVFTDSKRKQYLIQADQLASSGYKVIALAYQDLETATSIPVNDFTFLGIIGLIDPARPEVPHAIAKCTLAGIKVVMVTGDHPETAKEIGRQLGLVDPVNVRVVVGHDMKSYEALTDEDKKRWLSTQVFARVTPAQKLDLIKVFQENGAVVAMTGDGVNDAPALKKADIGIAMGLRGTQVAQDVADMVLRDDSFSSIVTAIQQGRIIFENIRRFVTFLLSCNLSELITIAVSSVASLHFQLLPLQILFINLITDVLPALALGMTHGSSDVMKQKPKGSSEPILTKAHWKSIIFYAIIISVCSLGAVLLSHFVLHSSEGWNPKLCNNILFFTLITSQLLHVFNMNSHGSNFFKSEIVRNKYIWYSLIINVFIMFGLYNIATVREVLAIHLLSLSDWMVVIAFSLLAMIINQTTKTLKIMKQ